MAFYAIYYFVNKIMPKRVNLIIGCISFIFICMAFAGEKLDNHWYGSTLCFVLGLIYYKHEEKIQRLIKKWFWGLAVGLVSLLVIAVGIFGVLGNDSIIGNPLARNLASLSFCMMILIILSRVRIGNQLSYCLGKCSYEIYLIHSFVLALLAELKVGSPGLFCWMVAGLSIVFAIGIHGLETKFFGTLVH